MPIESTLLTAAVASAGLSVGVVGVGDGVGDGVTLVVVGRCDEVTPEWYAVGLAVASCRVLCTTTATTATAASSAATTGVTANSHHPRRRCRPPASDFMACGRIDNPTCCLP
jgi:hypothetical protein